MEQVGLDSEVSAGEPAGGSGAGSGRALDAQCFHAGLQGRGRHAEQPGGPVFSGDPPAGPVQGEQQVVPLHLLELAAGQDCTWGSRFRGALSSCT